MTAPERDSTAKPARRGGAWLGVFGGLAGAAILAISTTVYFGLVARGDSWPVFVFAVASAPLALLAVVQGITAMGRLRRRASGDGENSP